MNGWSEMVLENLESRIMKSNNHFCTAEEAWFPYLWSRYFFEMQDKCDEELRKIKNHRSFRVDFQTSACRIYFLLELQKNAWCLYITSNLTTFFLYDLISFTSKTSSKLNLLCQLRLTIRNTMETCATVPQVQCQPSIPRKTIPLPSRL